MPPTDVETAVRIILEGALMKLGDVILMHFPSALKKGAAFSIVLVRRKHRKRKKK